MVDRVKSLATALWFQLALVGLLGLALIVSGWYYSSEPESPEMVAERFVELHYLEVVSAVADWFFQDRGLDPALVAALKEAMAEVGAPYECTMGDLRESALGIDMRCDLVFEVVDPFPVRIVGPLNVILDWNEDLFGRVVTRAVSVQVVGASALSGSEGGG